MSRSQQGCSFLDHPLSPGSPGPYHDGSRPPPGHLLPKLCHLSRVPGKALRKKLDEGGRQGAQKGPEKLR
jgi:hypothetical protein